MLTPGDLSPPIGDTRSAPNATALSATRTGNNPIGITPSAPAIEQRDSGVAAAAQRLVPSPARQKLEEARQAFSAPPREIVREEEEDEQTRIADASALAGAFNAAVSGHGPAGVADPLSLPGDEWFVGINGVPVGPIRLSELRSKAGSGAITKESLVWRDGFEEWRPLKTFPELVAIVEESLSSFRGSLTPFVPESPFPSRATAPGVEALSDPFGSSSGVGTGAGAGGARVSTVADDLEAAGLRPKRSSSTAMWIAMVVAVFFGLTLGFVFFSKQQKPAEVIKYVEVPAKGAETKATPSPNVAEPGAEDTPATTDSKTPGRGSGTSGKQPTKPEPESKLTGGLKGLGLSGLPAAGPKGPDSNAPPSSAGGQLDQAQLQSVVARYTSNVKRRCWQPALDTRDKDAPTSARVNVTISIRGSGSVDNVVTSGDPRGYRGLANCIAGMVRGWQFPASGGATTVNVPFVFVAQ